MRVQKYVVQANIPEKLKPIMDIAYNLWWTWNSEAIDLFRWMDDDLWNLAHHNPVKMFGMINADRYEELLHDTAFIAQMNKIHEDLQEYLHSVTWFDSKYKEKFDGTIAYFSFEFGIHESLSIYSGGLGVLSGDHLKSASDLGLPLVGMGLLYRHGYFHQYLNIDGWQQESYIENDFNNMPMTLVKGDDGKIITIDVELPGRTVKAQAWKIQVGRVPLYLLDTDIEPNSPVDRTITDKLYGGDQHTRIQQEILLGIGGIRLLDKLDITPRICHMNEGHASFLALERTRTCMEKHHLDFFEAKDTVSAGNLFTTHTPVPAGIDRFSRDMMDYYFKDYVGKLGLTIDKLMELGSENPKTANGLFSMPVLAFNFSSRSNAVSKLHGEVSRKMWRELWPNILESQIPLTHVTNGIHVRTWLSDEFIRLYERYIGPQVLDDHNNKELWKKVDKIPNSELWRAKERLKERLVLFTRKQLAHQMAQRGSVKSRSHDTDEVLNPRALTIGFARRFATYKRATLIFRDPERLARILNNRDMPVQIIIAGKAHPKDEPGKKLIKKIVQYSEYEEFRNRIVFIEDYNMDIARHLVQGVDIWLNNPRRPQEASGTSGMKVPPNGGLNLSVLDGWWVEGYNGNNGWAIGRGETYPDSQLEYQDEMEARALYELLEKEIVPLFYERGVDGLPHKWLHLMRESMRTVTPVFNTSRMVSEYFLDYYLPGSGEFNELTVDSFAKVRRINDFKRKIVRNWKPVFIEKVQARQYNNLKVGMKLRVEALVWLGDLKPEDVTMEAFYGHLSADGKFTEGGSEFMQFHKRFDDRKTLFIVDIPCDSAGRHGFAICIYPKTDGLCKHFEHQFIKWWES